MTSDRPLGGPFFFGRRGQNMGYGMVERMASVIKLSKAASFFSLQVHGFCRILGTNKITLGVNYGQEKRDRYHL